LLLIFLLEGARGIEPPPGFADRASGFEARGVPSTVAPIEAVNKK